MSYLIDHGSLELLTVMYPVRIAVVVCELIPDGGSGVENLEVVCVFQV